MSASSRSRARFEHVTRLWRNWHTRWLQEPLGASPWRFESSQPHSHLAWFPCGDHLEARSPHVAGGRSLVDQQLCYVGPPAAPGLSVRGAAEVAAVLELRSQGLGARRIAARTGLPVSTVRDWLAGRLPPHAT